MVLDRSTRAFVIQLVGLFDRVNSNRVTIGPIPSYGRPLEELDATPVDLQSNNTAGRNWLVNIILYHPTEGGKTLEFRVDWEGDCKPA